MSDLDPFRAALKKRVEAELTHDNAVLEKACEMSIIDPEGGGIKVDEQTGEVSLSSEVPYGCIFHYYGDFTRPMPIRTRLFLKEE